MPEADKVCPCGCELTRIGEEVSEKLDFIPATIQVIRHIRPKYACRACEGTEDDGPTVKNRAHAPAAYPPRAGHPGTGGLCAGLEVRRWVAVLPPGTHI
ncbi:IS66 family transposase zinc-finger binding domain-containing protein [Desulfovibrio sp. TomC]|uniref:IS66 family transposase zinc-finger binding domain-containing protein n=1 Tax=Desulfovibrio sp. TomC TaxID=1562888 RepID=UPI0022B168B3|nr:IS66 family transposase zinc-finger binding domain-containing protein [Desulfovibrio sp. TomC]